MSFHLLHAKYVNCQLVTLDSLRLPTRLGTNTIQSGYLDKLGWNHGLEDIGLLCEEIRELAPDRIVAVGTSAIRAASNAHAFVAEVRKRYDIDIEVLSAKEEAQLSYYGATSLLENQQDPLVVVDLGGGSCEIALGHGSTIKMSNSADIGVLPLREAFEINGTLGPIKARAIAEVVKMALRPSIRTVNILHPMRLVFSSGTTRAVHRLASSVLGNVTPQQITLAQVQSLRDFVVGRDPQEFIAHGVDTHRLDVIAIAVVVVETIMSVFPTMATTFSNRGLREGVALREFAWLDVTNTIPMNSGIRREPAEGEICS